MLDNYELYEMMSYAYGNNSDDKVEDNLFNGPLGFARFYEEAFTQKNSMAYLILTGKQYIFARNCGEGKQGHILSITKAFLEMEGKDPDITLVEASKIYHRYDKNFLIFSIEIRKDESRRRYEQVMRTTINNGVISPEEYRSFKTFYDEYRDVFKKSSLLYSIWDKKSGKYIPIKNIDKIDTYLSSIVDENAKPFDLGVKEKILGVRTEPEEPGQILRKCCKTE